jgi:hypothetical protein
MVFLPTLWCHDSGGFRGVSLDINAIVLTFHFHPFLVGRLDSPIKLLQLFSILMHFSLTQKKKTKVRNSLKNRVRTYQ